MLECLSDRKFLKPQTGHRLPLKALMDWWVLNRARFELRGATPSAPTFALKPSSH
jgi:hypothetical protein